MSDIFLNSGLGLLVGIVAFAYILLKVLEHTKPMNKQDSNQEK